MHVTPPDDDGGLPVIGYQVRMENNQGSYNLQQVVLNGDSIVLRNLQPNAQYRFHIAAKNDAGLSESYILVRTKTN